MTYTNPGINNSKTLTVDTLRAVLRALPPRPDDIVVHAHPLDILRGLLSFLAPKPQVSWEADFLYHNAMMNAFFSPAGIPVVEDKTFPEGTIGVHNTTRNTWYTVDLKEAKL